MSIVKQTARCPYCKEQINAEATICRHCRSDLRKTTDSGKSVFAPYNNFRFGFISGVLFALVMAILVYLQFYTD